jgi:hypothetical protein
MGALKKGYATDTPLGGFPVCENIYTKNINLNTSTVLTPTALAADRSVITKNSFASIDTYRCVLITVSNALHISKEVTIKGYDLSGQVITETLTLTDLTTLSKKPFIQILELNVPGYVTPGDTVSVGLGNMFGTARKMSENEGMLERAENAASMGITCPFGADSLSFCALSVGALDFTNSTIGSDVVSGTDTLGGSTYPVPSGFAKYAFRMSYKTLEF